MLTIVKLGTNIMTVSENYSNVYRTPDYIHMEIKDVLNSFLSFIDSKLNFAQSILVDKLKSLDIHITSQIMHIFEAPLDKYDFNDLINQVITGVTDDLIERAHSIGFISKNESDQLRKFIDKSKTNEFCSNYGSLYLM